MENDLTRKPQMIKPRGRWCWLLGVAGIAVLLPLGLIGGALLIQPEPLPGALLTFLPGYGLLALGPIISSVFWWHLIVHKRGEPTWKRGLAAALLAEVMAYPLTAMMVIVPNGLPAVFAHPEYVLQLPSVLLFLSVMSFVVFPRFGWYTTLCALFFGPLLGGLQGYTERKKRERDEDLIPPASL